MTNNDITNVIYNNEEVNALYWGDLLIFQRAPKGPTYGSLQLVGKLRDTAGSSHYYWWPNGTKTALAVDPDTKEFDIQYTAKTITSANYMFNGNGGPRLFERIDHIPDCSQATQMQMMFSNNNNLSYINLSDLNTANVTTMFSMFSTCSSLTNLDCSNFDTSNVTSTASMFSGCSSLATLNAKGWNLTKVTDMSTMFYGCTSLTDIIGPISGIGVNLSVNQSPLTNVSAMVLINGLKTASGKKLTLKASTFETLTNEQIAVATAKGWTVVA